jgi:cytochrome P450
VSGRRQALNDFAFSDGTRVKKGDWACVPVKAMLQDESFFPHAVAFEGFRFAPRDAIPGGLDAVMQPEGPSKYTDVSANYHAWGIGSIIW